MELEMWQVSEIKKALKEADAGDFATDAEVETFMGLWKYCESSTHPENGQKSFKAGGERV